MPRIARKKSESKIYHVMIRGINQQSIFEDDGDYKKLIEILGKYHKEIEYEIYAYCLMGNHIHLLIREGREELSNTMKRIGTSYVYWYNWQYSRKGHLFQDRYRSESVENDSYFLTVLRYIHQNPLKAGLVEDIREYKWSSYKEYFGESEMVNTSYALDIFHEDKLKAIKEFKEFNNKTNNDQCNEITEVRKTISDKEIRNIFLKRYNIELVSLQNQLPEIQKDALKYLKGLDGSSFRQLSRLTGFTVNKIFRA